MQTFLTQQDAPFFGFGQSPAHPLLADTFWENAELLYYLSLVIGVYNTADWVAVLLENFHHWLIPASEIILGESFDRPPVSVHLPFLYHASKSYPLLVMLHAYTADGPFQNLYFNLHRNARFEGYVLFYPDGLVDSDGNHYWTATEACCDLDKRNNDDAGYIKSLIDEVQTKVNIDANRIFLIGHSNGAFMSHRMACQYPELFAGFIALAGTSFYDNSLCTAMSDAADRKFSILQIIGTRDKINGGDILGVPFPSVSQTIIDWQANLGCTASDLVYKKDINLEFQLPGKETKVYKTAKGSCPTGIDITRWDIIEGKHIPIFGVHWPRHVFKWLNAHSRP